MTNEQLAILLRMLIQQIEDEIDALDNRLGEYEGDNRLRLPRYQDTMRYDWSEGLRTLVSGWEDYIQRLRGES